MKFLNSGTGKNDRGGDKGDGGKNDNLGNGTNCGASN